MFFVCVCVFMADSNSSILEFNPRTTAKQILGNPRSLQDPLVSRLHPEGVYVWHTACTPLPSAGLNLLVHLYLFLLPRMHTILHCTPPVLSGGSLSCQMHCIGHFFLIRQFICTANKTVCRHFICMSFSFFLAENKNTTLTLFSVVSYNKIAVSCCVLIVTVKLPQKKTLPASNFAETCTALGFFHVRSHDSWATGVLCSMVPAWHKCFMSNEIK